MRLKGMSSSASYAIFALEEAIIALWRNKPRAAQYAHDPEAFARDTEAYNARMLVLENMRADLYKEAKPATA